MSDQYYVVKWEDELKKQHELRTLTPVGHVGELRIVLRILRGKRDSIKYSVTPDVERGLLEDAPARRD